MLMVVVTTTIAPKAASQILSAVKFRKIVTLSIKLSTLGRVREVTEVVAKKVKAAGTP